MTALPMVMMKMEAQDEPQPVDPQYPVDLDRELDRWFALCKRDKAYRRAFAMNLNTGYGSIKTEMHRGKLKRVISEVVFTHIED